VASFVKALKSANSTFSDDNEFVNNYLSLRQNSSKFSAAAGETIDNFRGKVALKKFDLFAKAWQLRTIWKLDPVLMRDLNKTYGPIDLQIRIRICPWIGVTPTPMQSTGGQGPCLKHNGLP
jgi:hypothetical protein